MQQQQNKVDNAQEKVDKYDDSYDEVVEDEILSIINNTRCKTEFIVVGKESVIKPEYLEELQQISSKGRSLTATLVFSSQEGF